jgi:dTDP-4-amino-4,6-dideoxy-D-galactose acyltransferase
MNYNLKVIRLDWDSKCFGYEVGKLVVDHQESFYPEALPVLTKGFRLVYVFSKQALAMKFKNLYLADKRMIMKRFTSRQTGDFINIGSYSGGMTEQLLNLAFESGKFSRFKTDKAFKNNEFFKLYSEWIRKSVNRTIADDLFVSGKVNEIQGFITIIIKGVVAQIDLIAVDRKYRGLGIGSALIKYAINQAQTLGCLKIKVITQYKNRTAIDLYEKNGFELTDMIYIYHYRNE